MRLRELVTRYRYWHDPVIRRTLKTGKVILKLLRKDKEAKIIAWGEHR